MTGKSLQEKLEIKEKKTSAVLAEKGSSNGNQKNTYYYRKDRLKTNAFRSRRGRGGIKREAGHLAGKSQTLTTTICKELRKISIKK